MLVAANRKQCFLEKFQTIERKVGPDGHDNVALRRKFAPVAAKDLTNQSLDSISPHRIANFPLDAYSQTIPRQTVCRHNNGKSVSMGPPSGPIDALKLPGGS